MVVFGILMDERSYIGSEYLPVELTFIRKR